MFSGDPRLTAEYRDATAAGETDSFVSYHRCAKCGRERLHWLMKRISQGRSTRHTPSRWICKDGCAGANHG